MGHTVVLLQFSDYRNGQAHQEGRHYGQIWYPIRCFAPQNGQENGNHPARQVYMQLLWQGLNEADVCWYLELQAMWKDCCWRCLGVLYNSCSHCPLCGTSFEGNERAVKCLYNTLAMVSK